MKRIVALLMIGMLIFSISACSENTGSDVSSQITSNTNDVSSVEDTVSNTSDINNVSSVIESSSNVSSDVTSSQNVISSEETQVNSSNSNEEETSSKNNESESDNKNDSTSSVVSPIQSTYNGPVYTPEDFEKSSLAVHIKKKGIEKMKEVTPESLSELLEIEVLEIQSVKTIKYDSKEYTEIFFTIYERNEQSVFVAEQIIKKNVYVNRVDNILTVTYVYAD